ncbi:LOW QUALITY PROTEIN: hypothetical protein HID58_041029, partial [Brassica napus]
MHIVIDIRMKISKYIVNVLISIFSYISFVLSFVICSSLEVTIDDHPPSNLKKKGIKLHGILLWVSMGLLMPMGILFIRMGNKANENGRKVKVFFYHHAIFQILAVVLATIGAIITLLTTTIKGLALYATMWLQFLTGIFKPSRGCKRRLKWFLLHWILGTIVSIVGIRAYKKKTSSSRDSNKREHFQKQRVFLDELDNHHNNNTNGRSDIQVVTRSHHEQKVYGSYLVAKVTHFVGTVKRDKVELKAIKEGAVSYASLEKRLSYMRSLGELSDEEGEEKYCVDFFRKGVEHGEDFIIMDYVKADGEQDEGSLFGTRFAGLGRAVGTADIINQHVRMHKEKKAKQDRNNK